MVKFVAMTLNCFIVGTIIYLYGVEVGKSRQIPVDFQQQINYTVYRALLEGTQ
jgi:hypothetical protein